MHIPKTAITFLCTCHSGCITRNN